MECKIKKKKKKRPIYLMSLLFYRNNTDFIILKINI